MRPSSRAPGGGLRRVDLIACAAAFVLGLSGASANALQVLDVKDGVAVEAILSIKEATRIRIEGAPITDVFGNIHSSNCGPSGAPTPGSMVAPPPVNPAGEIVLECDRDKGEIYIRPVGDGTKPVNLFVSSAAATYTLVLRRSDTPADTIVIRDKTLRVLPTSVGASGGTGTAALGPAPSHIRAMKALLVAMASDRLPADIRVEELNRPVQLWAEARFLLSKRFEGRGLVGELYLLQNVSAAVMVLAEQEFDRPDSAGGSDGGQVVGIAIEHHNLRPGESTAVFVIRRGGER